MLRLYTVSACLLLVVGLSGCDSFVEDVDLPIDNIDDDLLNDPEQISFVITGVQARFSDALDYVTLLSGGLSDELIFDQNVPNATFPTFRELNECDVQFANNSVDTAYDFVNELRFFADDLGRRIETVEIEDADLLSEAQFTSEFYGAIARYFLATYFALTPDQPGGVITTDPDNPAPLTPAPELYTQALQMLDAARGSATEYQRKLISTVEARIHLFQGNYAEAATAAASGLQDGDEAFSVPYAVEDPIYWWTQGGAGRRQFVANFRFRDYLNENPDEAARIPLVTVKGSAAVAENADDSLYYYQNLYPERTSPMNFATWQENALIQAELHLRDGNDGLALNEINAVRASHGLDPLTEATMDVLIEERDKELFTEGQRLVDLRRFDLTVDEACVGPWRHMPITQSERNGNDNF